MNEEMSFHELENVAGMIEQSPLAESKSRNTLTNISASTSASAMKKRKYRGRMHRRKTLQVPSQIMFLIVLFSLLGIGDNSYQMGSKSKSQAPFFGSIFVSGFTVDDRDDGEKGRNRMELQSLPEIPVLRRLQKEAEKLRGKFTARLQPPPEEPAPPQITFSEILKKAGKSGMGGGIPGAIAGVIQVLSLMWLRTIMNYQCRYGATFVQAVATLNRQGGIPRFYRGLSFALIQAPLARFVATAANDGVETLLANLNLTQNWGPGRSTVIASIVVGMWRICLMPIDTCKTVLQVDSVEGFRNLMRKVKAGKIHVLYQGAAANAVSAIFSHYPWFYTYRVLSTSGFLQKVVSMTILRNALIGFISSVVSDTTANAIRVVKTTKQSIASKHSTTYSEVIAMILAADGWKGLFGRGLRTRILGNAVQSVLFTVIWRGLAENMGSRKEERQLSEKTDEDDVVVEENEVPLEEERF